VAETRGWVGDYSLGRNYFWNIASTEKSCGEFAAHILLVELASALIQIACEVI
jgi:hypothetical protein